MITEALSVTNHTGVTIRFNHDSDGYGIDQIMVNDQPLGPQLAGPLFLIRVFDDVETVLPVRLPLRDNSDSPQRFKWTFSGTQKVLNANLAITVELQLLKNMSAITMDIMVATDDVVPARIEAVFCKSANPTYWRANVYPWAEDASHLPEDIASGSYSIYCGNDELPSSPWNDKLLSWSGLPAVFFRSENRSISFLLGVTKDCDYGKPGTWMEGLSLEMEPDEAVRIVTGQASSTLKPGTQYHLPAQIMFSAEPDYLLQPGELVKTWTAINNYTAEAIPHPVLKNTKAMMDFMIKARKNAKYYIKGATYRCDKRREGMFDTYIINTPFNIYLDLLLAKNTGDSVWLERATEQLAWLKRMRLDDTSNINFGAFYPIAPGAAEPKFYQYKNARKEFEVEQNARAAYWLLKVAEGIKDKEFPTITDHDDLITYALETLSWVKKQQQPDGSIPQKVTDTGEINDPPTPAHTLLAFRYAHQLTNDKTWLDAMTLAETWTMQNSISPAKFFGAHSDLHPREYEEGSIHILIEYALSRYEDTGDRYYVKLAEYMAAISFLWRCPKQLLWVQDPTQGCNVEQPHYLQFSLYSYYSFKYLNFLRISELTNDPFFAQEGNFLLRQSAHCIVTQGEWAGAHYERLADPWDARKVDTTPEGKIADGNIYASELAPELLYQLMALQHLVDEPIVKTSPQE